MNIIKSPSPNHSPSAYELEGVQIHKTLGLMPGTLGWLQNPISQVSVHVLFAKNGDVHELVDHSRRPWAAGRFSNPSPRARKILKKTALGTWVKPGHYLLQCEFECLLHETFTEEQYQSAVEYLKSMPFEIREAYFLEHQDTAIYKPDLDKERTEILRRLQLVPIVPDRKKLIESLMMQILQLRLAILEILLKRRKRNR